MEFYDEESQQGSIRSNEFKFLFEFDFELIKRIKFANLKISVLFFSF